MGSRAGWEETRCLGAQSQGSPPEAGAQETELSSAAVGHLGVHVRKMTTSTMVNGKERGRESREVESPS